MDTGEDTERLGSGAPREPVALPAGEKILRSGTRIAGVGAVALATPIAETVILGTGVEPAAVEPAPAETRIVGAGAGAIAEADAAGATIVRPDEVEIAGAGATAVAEAAEATRRISGRGAAREALAAETAETASAGTGAPLAACALADGLSTRIVGRGAEIAADALAADGWIALRIARVGAPAEAVAAAAGARTASEEPI